MSLGASQKPCLTPEQEAVAGKTTINKKKRAGPGSYADILLLMNRLVKEEEEGSYDMEEGRGREEQTHANTADINLIVI